MVIPTHDTRELALRCVGSLPSNLEIILVDDGSRDGTAEAVSSSFPHVRILRNEQAQGFTRSANRGLAESRGEILLLLNSDTEVEPAGIDALLARFSEQPKLGIVGATLHYPDGSPQWSGGNEPSLLWLFGLASGLPPLLAKLPLYRRAKPLVQRSSSWVTGAALAIRRQALLQAGPLDEQFRLYAQDLDLCVRVRQAGWEIEILPEFRVLHHHGATIGAQERALGRQNLELLWTDLLRWARKNKGESWASNARRALLWGVRLRLAGRRFLPARNREEDQLLRKALTTVRSG
ncbi:MAG TPA: glycosyltransferase family 2 protein [Thermoanaerobaculia bacterium]|nr:glycosyltransferase family 2 protein [Thermoanaerobaculia bacterium]